AAADDDAAAVTVLGGEVDAGVLHRAHGRRHREVAEAVHPADFLDVGDVLLRLERVALAADPHRVLAGVPPADERDPALAGADVLPHLVGALAQRRDDPKTGNDDAAP